MFKNVVSYFFLSNNLNTIHKLCEIFFICGIILVFAFPLMSEHTFIIEKQLKNTVLHKRDIDRNFFIKAYQEYLSALNGTSYINNKILNFCQNTLNNKNNSYNKIFTKEIISPRGEKLKFIQINLIFDPNLTSKEKEKMHKANIIIYTILKFYSDPNNIPWLSRDIQFNYITKELFYDHPLECFNIISNGKYNTRVSFGKKVSGIINLDLTEFDIENFQKFSLRFHGVNSEQIDMDYYKMIYDNFISTLMNGRKFITHDNILSEKGKNNIKSFLKIPAFFFQKFLEQKLYYKYILYAINNILSNFFMINNRINTNHLLVTKNKNSVLMKIIPKNIIKNKDDSSNYFNDKNNLTSNKNSNYNKTELLINHEILTRYRNIVGAFELILKGISRDEIDLFRGQYFYILLNPKIFVGYYYLFILILLNLRVFYELITYIYSHQFNNINGGKIVGGILLTLTISVILFLHIGYIKTILDMDIIKTYYYIIGFIIIIQMIILISFHLNKEEEKVINEILMFIFILNCWNFIFINIGIGLCISIIILPMENLFLHLKSNKYNLFKSLILLFIIYSTLSNKDLLSSMLSNFLIFNNNVYIIISFTLFFLLLRMQLFIIMIINDF